MNCSIQCCEELHCTFPAAETIHQNSKGSWGRSPREFGGFGRNIKANAQNQGKQLLPWSCTFTDILSWLCVWALLPALLSLPLSRPLLKWKRSYCWLKQQKQQHASSFCTGHSFLCGSTWARLLLQSLQAFSAWLFSTEWMIFLVWKESS